MPENNKIVLLVSLFAYEAIVLVIGIVLGVPLELSVEVHVEEGVAGGLLVVLEVLEHHLCPGEPLETRVPVRVQAAKPVVSPVLGVDSIEHTLDEVGLLCIQDVCQVSALLVAELLGLED